MLDKHITDFEKILYTSKVYKACQNSWLYAPFGGVWCIYKGVRRNYKKPTTEHIALSFFT